MHRTARLPYPILSPLTASYNHTHPTFSKIKSQTHPNLAGCSFAPSATSPSRLPSIDSPAPRSSCAGPREPGAQAPTPAAHGVRLLRRRATGAGSADPSTRHRRGPSDGKGSKRGVRSDLQFNPAILG